MPGLMLSQQMQTNDLTLTLPSRGLNLSWRMKSYSWEISMNTVTQHPQLKGQSWVPKEVR